MPAFSSYYYLLRVNFSGSPFYEPTLNAASYFPNYRQDSVGRLAAFSVTTLWLIMYRKHDYVSGNTHTVQSLSVSGWFLTVLNL